MKSLQSHLDEEVMTKKIEKIPMEKKISISRAK
jgi:hypothetical protein